MVVSGRSGYASFINGHYDSVLQFIGGRPTYKCAHVIQNTEEYKYGPNVGKPLFLFYHSTNECWVISQLLGGDHIIAYCDGDMARPEQLEDVWHVAGSTGDFDADGSVACCESPSSSAFSPAHCCAAHVTACSPPCMLGTPHAQATALAKAALC